MYAKMAKKMASMIQYRCHTAHKILHVVLVCFVFFRLIFYIYIYNFLGYHGTALCSEKTIQLNLCQQRLPPAVHHHGRDDHPAGHPHHVRSPPHGVHPGQDQYD